MQALLDENGLDRRPHNITSDTWYYEETDGLHFYYDTGHGVVKIGTVLWRSIAASLGRHDAATKKRVKKPAGRSHRNILRKSGIILD